jgi:hypothetical protein
LEFDGAYAPNSYRPRPAQSPMTTRRGRSVAGIAKELNERDVPCPSRVDPGRGPQRCRMDAAHGSGDPGQPALHRPASLEPATHRPRPARLRRRPARRVGGTTLEPDAAVVISRERAAPTSGQRGRLRRRHPGTPMGRRG